MRLATILTGLGLLCGSVGCQHIAGFCDCAPPVQPCCIYGLYPGCEGCRCGVVAIADGKPAVVAPAPAPVTPPPVKAPAGIPMSDTIKEHISLPKDS